MLWNINCYTFNSDSGERRLLTARQPILSAHYFRQQPPEELKMKWETPKYDDIRFGFEVTMYINNR